MNICGFKSIQCLLFPSKNRISFLSEFQPGPKKSTLSPFPKYIVGPEAKPHLPQTLFIQTSDLKSMPIGPTCSIHNECKTLPVVAADISVILLSPSIPPSIGLISRYNLYNNILFYVYMNLYNICYTIYTRSYTQ